MTFLFFPPIRPPMQLRNLEHRDDTLKEEKQPIEELEEEVMTLV